MSLIGKLIWLITQRSLVQIQPPQPIKSITYDNWPLSVSPRYPPIGTDCNLLDSRSDRICG